MIKKREMFYLDTNRIYPNPYQARKIFEQNSLNELCLSIERYGVLEPILVRDLKDGLYEIISGERRLKACKKLGISKIPAIVLNISNKELASIVLVENMQRQELNFIEEAEGFQSLMVDFGYSQGEIAKFVGKKESAIASKMRLLKLKKDIKNIIVENNLSERQASAILKIDDIKVQKEVLAKVLKFDLNANKTEQLVYSTLKRLSGESLKKEKKIKGYIGDIRIFTNTIKDAVEVMKDSGIETDYCLTKKDGNYEINIKVSIEE